MTPITTTYSTVEWDHDRQTVTKTRHLSGDAQARYDNELRINRLLRDDRPVATPLLLANDDARLQLTFEAVDGTPLGPKYPLTLSRADISEIREMTVSISSFRPRASWLRRLDPARRFETACDAGLLTARQVSNLAPAADRSGQLLTFAHGDITARNVLRTPNGLVVIDWEWAGLYPAGYDMAFLWYSLIDVPGGRGEVESCLGPEETSFWVCALAIQLHHLQWFVSPEFRDKHLARRDELIAQVGTP